MNIECKRVVFSEPSHQRCSQCHFFSLSLQTIYDQDAFVDELMLCYKHIHETHHEDKTIPIALQLLLHGIEDD